MPNTPVFGFGPSTQRRRGRQLKLLYGQEQFGLWTKKQKKNLQFTEFFVCLTVVFAWLSTLLLLPPAAAPPDARPVAAFHLRWKEKMQPAAPIGRQVAVQAMSRVAAQVCRV